MSEKKNFFSTLPGILTGTATVITAGLGLVSTLNNNSSEAAGNQQPAPIVSPSPFSSASPSLSPEVLTDELPEADVVPDSLEYGDQGLGQGVSKSVTVINSGDAELVIDGFSIDGEGAGSFKVVQDTCENESISPDDRCQITVQFTPAAASSYFATLELSHNAQDTPTEIPLSGKGTLLQL